MEPAGVVATTCRPSKSPALRFLQLGTAGVLPDLLPLTSKTSRATAVLPNDQVRGEHALLD